MRLKSLFTIFFLVFLVAAFYYLSQDIVGKLDTESAAIKPVRCKVEEVIIDNSESEVSDNTESGYEMSLFSGGQSIKVKIMEGVHKGKRILVQNTKMNVYTNSNVVAPGDEILAFLEEDAEGKLVDGILYELVRTKHMYMLIAAFFVLLVAFGGMKGFKSVITLSITFIAVIKIMLPLILKGHSPFTISVCICILVTLTTLIISNGFSTKTFNAVLGTIGGVLIAGLIAYIMGHVSKLTGLGTEEAQMLLLAPVNIKMDFRGLLFAGIIMGALGAVMDVSVSIASAMNEIESAKPNISSRELIDAGMNVGRDVMGTMSDTLILAYIGGSIHLVLILMIYNYPLTSTLSMDMITSEIVRAISGSIGLVFTIPITALISGSIGRKAYRANRTYTR